MKFSIINARKRTGYEQEIPDKEYYNVGVSIGLLPRIVISGSDELDRTDIIVSKTQTGDIFLICGSGISITVDQDLLIGADFYTDTDSMK